MMQVKDVSALERVGGVALRLAYVSPASELNVLYCDIE